jgi:hypothetical protein
MALTTTFKKSVPYNTIRLVGDVAQWAQTEQTYLNNTSYPPIIGMNDVSMATLQVAGGAAIDPGEGTVDSGSLGDMRYGISVLADVSAGDGVYGYQVQGTSDDFVETRSWNLASNPIDVSLGRIAQWDYTANLEMPDIDKYDVSTSTTADWRATAPGNELFKDMPMWGFGARDSANTSSRKVYLFRSHPNGGRYSSYAVTNRLIVAHVADMNDIQAVCTVRSEFGNNFDTQIRSYITFGRRTSSTGNIKAALYNILIDPPTSTWTSTNSTTANISTQFGNNAAVGAASYLRDDLVAMVCSRGAAGTDLVRVSTSGGTISSVRTALSTAAKYGVGCGVVTIPDETGSSPLAFPIWMETQSTYNRYVKMKGYNLNTTTFTQSHTVVNVFDATNSILSCGGTLLKAGTNLSSDPHFFLVWASDSSGDVRLQVVGAAQGTMSITGYPSTTIQYNDTNLINFVTISALSAVEKTSIVKSGEAFTPGGTNDFEKRRYFAISIATNQSQDTNALYYGYYDFENSVLQVWDGGSFVGREMRLAQNNHDTDGRQFARDLYLRGEAGAVWMPLLGGRYIGASDRRLSFGMAALDFKPNWSGLNAADPGGTTYDQGGEIGSTGIYFDTPNDTEPTWGVTGRWYVLGPHPLYPGNTTNLCSFKSNYASNVTFSDGVGSNLTYFWCYERDIDSFVWSDFMSNGVASYNQGNSVYIKVETGALEATFRLPPGSNQIIVNDTVTNPYFLIDFPGTNNTHAGNAWGFLWNSSTGETKNAVAITFSQSPF